MHEDATNLQKIQQTVECCLYIGFTEKKKTMNYLEKIQNELAKRIKIKIIFNQKQYYQNKNVIFKENSTNFMKNTWERTTSFSQEIRPIFLKIFGKKRKQ